METEEKGGHRLELGGWRDFLLEFYMTTGYQPN